AFGPQINDLGVGRYLAIPEIVPVVSIPSASRPRLSGAPRGLDRQRRDPKLTRTPAERRACKYSADVAPAREAPKSFCDTPCQFPFEPLVQSPPINAEIY